MNSVEPNLKKAVENDDKFFSNIFSALKEVLWPWYSGTGGIFNGWNHETKMLDKVSCILFAKPWAWLLWVTIVSVFVLFVLAIFAQFGSLSKADFTLVVFIMTIIICSFCIAYTVAALVMWKNRYKYDKNYFTDLKNSMVPTTSKTVPGGALLNAGIIPELTHIETSNISN